MYHIPLYHIYISEGHIISYHTYQRVVLYHITRIRGSYYIISHVSEGHIISYHTYQRVVLYHITHIRGSYYIISHVSEGRIISFHMYHIPLYHIYISEGHIISYHTYQRVVLYHITRIRGSYYIISHVELISRWRSGSHYWTALQQIGSFYIWYKLSRRGLVCDTGYRSRGNSAIRTIKMVVAVRYGLSWQGGFLTCSKISGVFSSCEMTFHIVLHVLCLNEIQVFFPQRVNCHSLTLLVS